VGGDFARAKSQVEDAQLVVLGSESVIEKQQYMRFNLQAVKEEPNLICRCISRRLQRDRDRGTFWYGGLVDQYEAPLWLVSNIRKVDRGMCHHRDNHVSDVGFCHILGLQPRFDDGQFR
jgi:hypothetical protein